MIQPFWALPALGIAGLNAKDVMGFCIIDLLYSGVIIALGFNVYIVIKLISKIICNVFLIHLNN